MIVVYPSRHVRHRPPNEIFNGNRDPHAEVPERIERIKSSLEEINGIQIILPRRFPLSWIEQVHDHAYIDYLADAGRQAGVTYVYPSVFPYGENQQTTHSIGLRGMYSFDTYTPINCATYEAARGSAMAALTAASYVRRGERVTYALCRPPGHHAERARMGGYCYFNNTAIAANYLSRRGTVAILDVDLHHGNGTQAIFYNRSDVLTISIHASPEIKFPFFTGWERETGTNEGLGRNTNYPLAEGTENHSYHHVLLNALRQIKEFNPQFLVLALGYDTHVSDPIGAFHLTTPYYAHMAEAVVRLHLPTVIVQEGGYNTDALGDNAVSFVRGFLRQLNENS